jgi:serine/threonine protein kinase
LLHAGRVKVADFGLAKIVAAVCDRREGRPRGGSSAVTDSRYSELTDAGKLMGTPPYMSPEQHQNPADVDHRADIYALFGALAVRVALITFISHLTYAIYLRAACGLTVLRIVWSR